MPRWHFFEIFCASVLCLFVCLFFFLGRMLAFFCVLSRSDETTTTISRAQILRETRRREDSPRLLRTGDSVSSFLPGRRTVNRCIRDTKEREREMRDLSVLCPSSFGHLCALWSTFSVPTFFPLFRREKEKTSKKFCSFLVSLFFTLLLFVLLQNKLRV